MPLQPLPFSVPASPERAVAPASYYIPKLKPVRPVPDVTPIHRPQRAAVRSMFRPPMPISKETT